MREDITIIQMWRGVEQVSNNPYTPRKPQEASVSATLPFWEWVGFHFATTGFMSFSLSQLHFSFLVSFWGFWNLRWREYLWTMVSSWIYCLHIPPPLCNREDASQNLLPWFSFLLPRYSKKKKVPNIIRINLNNIRTDPEPIHKPRLGRIGWDA